MPERSKWIDPARAGYELIYTRDIGTDDPCDKWPLHSSFGVVYITTYERVEHPVPGWIAHAKPFR